MRQTFFCCAACDVELTEFLTPLSETALDFEIGANAVPAGHFVQLSSAWTYRDFLAGRQLGYSGAPGNHDVIAFEADDLLLHIDDVSHLVMPKAAYGCCGLQPRGELNATCRNGHPIGTIHGDCWAASVFRLAKSRVSVLAV